MRLPKYVTLVKGMAESMSNGVGAGVNAEGELTLDMYPYGIDKKKYNNQCVLFHDPNNRNAKMLMIYRRLYETVPAKQLASKSLMPDWLGVDGFFVIEGLYHKKPTSFEPSGKAWRIQSDGNCPTRATASTGS
jgi:hypothetical protein